MEKYTQRCIGCHKEFDSFCTRCPACNGLIDISYETGNLNFAKSENPYIRFFDLLPIKSKKNILWLGDGNTPLIKSQKLAEALKIRNLYLKYEGLNPTSTTKDRMATVALSYMFEHKVKEFAFASTGNTATSYAYGINKYPLFKMHLVYHGSPHRLNFPDSKNICLYKIRADFAKASLMVKSLAERLGIVAEGGFFNPARREGLKVAVLEAYDQMDLEPDWYFQAISSGMGIWGVNKACHELLSSGKISKRPKLAVIQEDTCDPICKSFWDDSKIMKPEYVIRNPKGITKAILRGDPTMVYPYVYRIVKDSKGTAQSVSKKDILDAMNLLKRYEGLDCGPASGVALAGVIKLIRTGKADPDEVFLVNLTEGRRKTDIWPKKFLPLKLDENFSGEGVDVDVS